MLDLLRRGHANARPMRVLRELSGWDEREIQLFIQRERLKGSPILSGSAGYWLAETHAEIEAWEQRELSRIKNQLATLRGVRRGRTRSGQGELWAA